MSQLIAVARGRGRRRQSIVLRIPTDAELVRAAIELRELGADGRPAAGRYGSCIGLYLPPRDYSTQEVDPFTGARGDLTRAGTIGPSCAFWCDSHRVADTLYHESPPAIYYYAKRGIAEQLNLFDPFHDVPGEEGAPMLVEQSVYERDRRLREMCLQARGQTCLVCGFDAVSSYGAEALGLIEVHHLQPLSDVGEAHTVDPLRDLIPVCPNCHAVIHRRTPPFTPEEVRAMLEASRN